MKITKTETAFIAVAAAAVFFTAGYFSGRSAGGDINVTVEAERPATTQTDQAQTEPTQTAPVQPEPSQPDQEPPAENDDGLVDINTATVWELMELPGIGEVLAGRIVEYREENGAFSCGEELMNVRGIGEKLFDRVAGLITCG